MKKIGVLLKSKRCNPYLYKTLLKLAQSNDVQLVYLINKKTDQNNLFLDKLKFKLKQQGARRFFQLIVFKLIQIIELKLLSKSLSKIRAHTQVKDLNDIPHSETLITPDFSPSRLFVTYHGEEIKKLEALKLDLILRGNAEGIFQGDILKVAAQGVISFHHGDNRWNRGGPAAFWEVYFKKPSTGFIIQRLNQKLDGGAVLFRGNVPTKRSYTENLVNIYRESNGFMAQLILNYVGTGQLSTTEEPSVYSGPIYKSPNFLQSINYLRMISARLVYHIVNKLILKKDERWEIAFLKGGWQGASLHKGTPIKSPSGHFFADPFVVTRHNRTIIYLEDYIRKLDRACITAVEIFEDHSHKILGPVIEEPFHMSFPYIFEHEGDLYMIPETAEDKSIRLYKCMNFPMKWVFQKELLSNISASDTMVFEHNNQWWMLTNLAAGGSSNHCSQLAAYYSDHPIEREWIAHDANPLIVNSDIGRNAGILNIHSEALPIRCRQRQGFNTYGAGLSLAQIQTLTQDTFEEQKICDITPDFFKNLKGCHHMHSNEKYTVFDYFRFESFK